MDNRHIVVILILLVIVSAGVFVFLQRNEEAEDSMTGGIKLPSGEEPKGRPGIQGDFNDTLGLKDVFFSFMTGISDIVEKEGTTADVIVLVEIMEVELNATIDNVELNEDQATMVNQMRMQLELARDLAESGSSPSQILEKVRSQKQLN